MLSGFAAGNHTAPATCRMVLPRNQTETPSPAPALGGRESCADTKNAEAAKALINFLMSPGAIAGIKAKGLTPG